MSLGDPNWSYLLARVLDFAAVVMSARQTSISWDVSIQESQVSFFQCLVEASKACSGGLIHKVGPNNSTTALPSDSLPPAL